MAADGTGDPPLGTAEGWGSLGRTDRASSNGLRTAEPAGHDGPVDLSETLMTLASATDQMMEEVYASTAELVERLRLVAEVASERIDSTAAESQHRLTVQGELIGDGMERAVDRLSTSLDLAVARARLLLEATTTGQVNAVRQATEQSVEDARLRMANVTAASAAELQHNLEVIAADLVAAARESAATIQTTVADNVASMVASITESVSGSLTASLAGRQEVRELVGAVEGLRQDVSALTDLVQRGLAGRRRAVWVPRPPA